MTLVDAPKGTSDMDEAQLLFQEARDRRRHRWLTLGITVGVVVIILAVVLGITLRRSGGSTASPATTPVGRPAISHSTASLNFRPVLCSAPALTLAPGQSAAVGRLPTCSPSSQLTAANLSINTETGQATGNPAPDPQFSSYPSTPPGSAGIGDTVLLQGASGQGGGRYVLGPAAVTQKGVASATAVEEAGQWFVIVRLTPQGSVQWDTLAAQQFHAIIGVVDNGKVISAPVTQPTQSSPTSFDGQVGISGGFTQQQAEALARGL
jgi:hypothetical protein